jgi:hypothetical protein
MNYLKKKFKTEIEKWDKRKKGPRGANATTYLTDSQKTQEHKRVVMDTMKAIMFAPITLTSMVIGGVGMGKKEKTLMADIEPISSEVENRKDTVTYSLDDSSMNSLVSLELALHLMHTDKESLGRALVISSSTDITKLYLTI